MSRLSATTDCGYPKARRCTIDEMGRSAVRDGLKKIVIRNTDQYSSTSGFAFEGGVLTIDHRPHVNVDYSDERAKGLQKVLESAL